MNTKQRHVILSGALALALSVTLIAGALSTAKATEATSKAANLKESMSLTIDVNTGVKEYLEKLPEGSAGIVYDLYKIAEAKDKGSGMYYELTPEFKDLDSDFKAVVKAKDPAVDYMAFAQKALASLFGSEDGNEVTSDRATYAGNALYTKVSTDPGLYLLVVRGEEAGSTTIKTYTKSSSNKTDGNAEEGLTTLTRLNGFSVTASPQVMSFPTKTDEIGNIVSTDADGEWVYDQTRELKLLAEPDTGSIEINKSLTGYNEGNENATFVFKVDTVKEDGTKFSSEVYSIQFGKDDEPRKTMRIDGLPIGATVTVTEIYSGVAYDAQVGPQHTVVEREIVNSVDFRNEYNDWQGGGGGIVNHFKYVDDGTGLKWTDTREQIMIKEDGNVNTQNGRPNK